MLRLSFRVCAILLCALFSQDVRAQSTPPMSPIAPGQAHVFESEDFRIEIDTVALDIGPLADADLTGYNCYRLFVTTANLTDQLSAVFGNIDAPAELLTSGDFFQSYPVGDITPSGVISAVWSSFPSNEFDSYFTIGIDGPPVSANGEGDVLTLQSSQSPWQPVFEPGNGAVGSGFGLTDLTGGMWFTQSTFTNGIAGDDQRILIAQLTTNGTLSGNLNVQIFLEGDNQFGSIYLNLDIPVYGCTDPAACNFNPAANEEDGSCAALDACGICNGPGAIYDCGCDGIPAGDCDCNGNQLDALGVCGGNCAADADGDGLCDDVDDCIGSYDACGICNGPGAIYDCGCDGIPAGDCDCDGNQLDALGVCGGNCAADADGDGICDVDEIPGCTDENAVNFDPVATDEDGSCSFAGCTDPTADNFNPSAISDNTTCAYTCTGLLGCTYVNATNYEPEATCDNGSCEFVLTVDDGCMFDVDDSGFIGSADLLIFLQYFESFCE